MTVLTLVLVIVACLIYLAQIGLPPTLQAQLTARLRQQGWEVQFSKMRLSFSRMGIIAENLYLRRAAGPQIYVGRAQCRMRGSALRRMKLELATVKLSGARVIWPLEKTHEPSSTFLLNNVRGELYFQENDVWDLRNLSATMMGARVNISGTLTNGSLLRDWRVPQLRSGVREDNLARWRAFLNAAHQIHFEGAPEIVTRFDGDAARLDESRANLTIHVPGVTSPWGSGSNLLISAHLNHEPAEADHALDLDILFEQGNTPWAQATAFRFKTTIGMDFANLIAPTNLIALVETKSVSGPWGTIELIAGEVLLSGSPYTAPGLQTIFNLKTGPLRHQQFEAAGGEIRASAWHNRTNWFVAALRDLAATNRPLNVRLEQIPAELDLSLSAAKAGVVDAEELLIRTKWHWPITRIAVEGKIEEGGLRGAGSFNATNRQAEFSATSDVDPHRISPLLPESARNWLTNYQWQAAPKVQVNGQLTLPVTTNKLNWTADVMPHVFAEGAFELGPCRYRAVAMDSAKSKFWLSNSVFCLPALELRRGDGSARGTYTSMPATRDFHWLISSRMDPKILRPLFPSDAEQQAFGLVEFGSLPRISGQLWGRWGDPSRLGAIASVEVTNFTVRGQAAQVARAGITFTNMVLDIVEPEVIRPNEQGNASRISIDLADQRIYFTNVHGNLDPYAVSRAIGQSASNAIAPYVFSVPPEITVNGVLDIKSGRREDDMHFLINGGPFYWDPFHVHRIGGRIHWAGYNLLLNDLVAQLHGGQASGDARFEIATNGPTRFQFHTEWSDIDLRSLIKDLSTKTNNLEGIVRGNLQITSANTGNPKSWNGRGMVELKDGLLWDFPMFGVFSPMLNAFVPGLGNSRARDGAASYIITNSVIHTTDLEINATAMRMRFSGTIDFDRRIDGRMEAELLRNTPVIGLVISKILWPVTKLFEYRITGPLEQPKTEPLYVIPKIILFPFSPIKSIRELIGAGQE
ncbi:MAG TPA: AsmA-like C-terminal region-containing protein [Verrucomicrobiae bacterium]|nr:AsmA-like C-terminal region-containing protein [Verrucomicrobiae bacterium]